MDTMPGIHGVGPMDGRVGRGRERPPVPIPGIHLADLVQRGDGSQRCAQREMCSARGDSSGMGYPVQLGATLDGEAGAEGHEHDPVLPEAPAPGYSTSQGIRPRGSTGARAVGREPDG